MKLVKSLNELVENQVINRETADKIASYYHNKKDSTVNRLFIIFGVLGALLVGLGIILIVAHNWDELSRATQTIFAFLPLIVGQAISIYVLLRKKESIAWREGTSTFLVCAIAACISLVSQIYNIPGELSTYLLTCSLLSLPLVYVMRSSMVSILYLAAITYYGSEVGYGYDSATDLLHYWGLLLGIIPHYYQLFKDETKANFQSFHNWLIPISVMVVLGSFTENVEELMFVAYFSLFGLFYNIGSFKQLAKQRAISNGYRIIGALGSIVILLMLSFNWFWDELIHEEYTHNEVFSSFEFIVSAIISALACVRLFFLFKTTPVKKIDPYQWMFVIFIFIFLLGFNTNLPILLINMSVFALGIWTLYIGVKMEHIGILNFGLIIITALIVCRFFDTNISFVMRGIMFVLVGAGFFVSNYLMIKKRNSHEQ
ncbi:MAG: DUF2157 domain-containing protein [Bacteroidales bacterium]|nr:DUF2157 domain-containing protein [Bacteroidales bacterium]